jgi:hypothetical protein
MPALFYFGNIYTPQSKLPPVNCCAPLEGEIMGMQFTLDSTVFSFHLRRFFCRTCPKIVNPDQFNHWIQHWPCFENLHSPFSLANITDIKYFEKSLSNNDLLSTYSPKSIRYVISNKDAVIWHYYGLNTSTLNFKSFWVHIGQQANFCKTQKYRS